MPHLMLKDLPRYECIRACVEQYPEGDPEAGAVFLHLLRTADELDEVKTELMRRHNISSGRFTVLMLLSTSGDDSSCAETGKLVPLSPAELADMAGVTRATMTGLVDTLEKDGLVRRETDPRDRRAMQVHLTPEGKSFMDDFLPRYFKVVTTIMAPLSGPEKKKLVQLLTKIRGSLAEASQVETTNPSTV
jgi:DNA-binding MarR family transcriptional regulator